MEGNQLQNTLKTGRPSKGKHRKGYKRNTWRKRSYISITISELETQHIHVNGSHQDSATTSEFI